MKTLRSSQGVSGQGELEGSSPANNKNDSASSSASIGSKVSQEALKDDIAIRKSDSGTCKQSATSAIMFTTDEIAEDTPKEQSCTKSSTDGGTEQDESGAELTANADEDMEGISRAKNKPILFSTGVPCDTLHRFNELAIEIREMIWKFAAAVEQGRIVQIKLDILGDPWKAISKTYVPAILHVCRDARKYALPYYYLLKCDDNHMPYGFRHTYINWETDALFFRTTNTAYQFLHGQPKEEEPPQDGSDQPYYDALGRLVDTSAFDVWDGEKYVPPIPADAMTPDIHGRRFPNEITIRKNCKKVIVPVEAAGEVIHPQHRMKDFVFYGIEELYFVLDIPLNTLRMDLIETNLREIARDDIRLQKGQRYEREGENEDISHCYENVLYLIDKEHDKINRRKKPVRIMLMDLVDAGKKRRN